MASLPEGLFEVCNVLYKEIHLQETVLKGLLQSNGDLEQALDCQITLFTSYTKWSKCIMAALWLQKSDLTVHMEKMKRLFYQLEGVAWRTIYKLISHYRAYIKKLDAQKQSSVAEAAQLRTFLSHSSSYYIHLLGLFSRKTKSLSWYPWVDQMNAMDVAIEFPDGLDSALAHQALEDARPLNPDQAKAVCRNCLVYLGDLGKFMMDDSCVARYRQATGIVKGTTSHSNFAESAVLLAQQFYEKAIEMDPHHGNAFNQLAVNYVAQGQDANSLLFYTQSVCVKEPFMTALDNLNLVTQKLSRKATRMDVQGKQVYLAWLSASFLDMEQVDGGVFNSRQMHPDMNGLKECSCQDKIEILTILAGLLYVWHVHLKKEDPSCNLFLTTETLVSSMLKQGLDGNKSQEATSVVGYAFKVLAYVATLPHFTLSNDLALIITEVLNKTLESFDLSLGSSEQACGHHYKKSDILDRFEQLPWGILGHYEIGFIPFSTASSPKTSDVTELDAWMVARGKILALGIRLAEKFDSVLSPIQDTIESFSLPMSFSAPLHTQAIMVTQESDDEFEETVIFKGIKKSPDRSQKRVAESIPEEESESKKPSAGIVDTMSFLGLQESVEEASPQKPSDLASKARGLPHLSLQHLFPSESMGFHGPTSGLASGAIDATQHSAFPGSFSSPMMMPFSHSTPADPSVFSIPSENLNSAREAFHAILYQDPAVVQASYSTERPFLEKTDSSFSKGSIGSDDAPSSHLLTRSASSIPSAKLPSIGPPPGLSAPPIPLHLPTQPLPPPLHHPAQYWSHPA